MEGNTSLVILYLIIVGGSFFILFGIWEKTKDVVLPSFQYMFDVLWIILFLFACVFFGIIIILVVTIFPIIYIYKRITYEPETIHVTGRIMEIFTIDTPSFMLYSNDGNGDDVSWQIKRHLLILRISEIEDINIIILGILPSEIEVGSDVKIKCQSTWDNNRFIFVR